MCSLKPSWLTVLADSRDRGIELMNIDISQSLSRAHKVLLDDVLQSSLTEFSQSDKSLCSLIYSTAIPIFYLAIRSTKIGLYLMNGLKLKPPNLRVALILSAFGGRVLKISTDWISLEEDTPGVPGLYEITASSLMELSQVKCSSS